MNRIIKEDIEKIIENNEMEKLKNKTILVTGATGMIGSYFINTFILLNGKYNMNINVIALVRNKSKFKDYILNNQNITIIESDVTEKINIDGKIDYIIHAASPASPKIMKDKPFETNAANTVGTYNTLKLAIEKKSLGFLFISSREIYGQPVKGVDIFYENGSLGDIDHLLPRNGYAEGKKAAENMCASAKEEYGLNTKIARLAHTYGPGMSIYDGRVQAEFLKNVIFNENIIMRSEGNSVRTYTYIADAVDALFKILLSSKEMVYNISSEEDKITIKELAYLLSDLSKNSSEVIIEIDDENKKGNSPFTLGILSSEKIRKELNWKPFYDVEEGFKRTIEYLKEEI